MPEILLRTEYFGIMVEENKAVEQICGWWRAIIDIWLTNQWTLIDYSLLKARHRLQGPCFPSLQIVLSDHTFGYITSDQQRQDILSDETWKGKCLVASLGLWKTNSELQPPLSCPSLLCAIKLKPKNCIKKEVKGSQTSIIVYHLWMWNINLKG